MHAINRVDQISLVVLSSVSLTFIKPMLLINFMTLICVLKHLANLYVYIPDPKYILSLFEVI